MYYRDLLTNLDYADQRYYSSLHGRFVTADPYVASTKSVNPQSWNRYVYVLGNPSNYVDPRGLEACTWDPVINTLNCQIDNPPVPTNPNGPPPSSGGEQEAENQSHTPVAMIEEQVVE